MGRAGRRIFGVTILHWWFELFVSRGILPKSGEGKPRIMLVASKCLIFYRPLIYLPPAPAAADLSRVPRTHTRGVAVSDATFRFDLPASSRFPEITMGLIVFTALETRLQSMRLFFTYELGLSKRLKMPFPALLLAGGASRDNR